MTGLFLSFMSAGQADPLQDQRDAATAMLEAILKSDFEAAAKRYDETMLKVLGPEKLKQTWQQVTDRLGTLKKRTGIRTEAGPKNDFVFITCEFEKQTLDLKVAFDKEKRIVGFRFIPTHTPEFAPPSYAKRDAFREEEVVVGKDTEWPLPGTLAIPKGEGKFACVILLHGSGPHDRDETIGPNKPFRDIAWGLASQGIAVLRFEKRTKEHGIKFAALKRFSYQEEVIDDARAAAALLRTHPAIDPKRIIVAGHSLGAAAAPRVGEQEPGLAGVILLAGNSRPLEDIVLEQYQYIFSLKGELSDDNRQELEKIKKQVARVKDPQLTADVAVSELPLKIPGGYWLYLRNYDNVATAAKLKMPLLILQGERDYQVTMDDLNGWKKGLASRSDVTFKSYPALNHLFMEGMGKARPAEYDKPGHVAKEVIDDIATWVKAR
jgi:hypothetical protein